MIFFLHIPKTAGTTFYEVVKANHKSFLKPKIENSPIDYLKNNIKNSNTAIRLPGGYESAPQTLKGIEGLNDDVLEKISFIGGHVGFGYHEQTNQQITYISFLRDPKKRLISDYKEHCKKGRFFYNTLLENEFSFNAYLNAVKEYKLDNIMTRQLAGPYDFFLKNRKMVDEELFERAQENAKLVTFFRMEDFDLALLYLKKKYNWKRIKYQRKNESISKMVNSVINKKLLNEVVEYDLKLYSDIIPIQKAQRFNFRSLFTKRE